MDHDSPTAAKTWMMPAFEISFDQRSMWTSDNDYFKKGASFFAPSSYKLLFLNSI